MSMRLRGVAALILAGCSTKISERPFRILEGTTPVKLIGEATYDQKEKKIRASLYVVNCTDHVLLVQFKGPPGDEFKVDWEVQDVNGRVTAFNLGYGYRGAPSYRELSKPNSSRGRLTRDAYDCLMSVVETEYPCGVNFEPAH